MYKIKEMAKEIKLNPMAKEFIPSTFEKSMILKPKVLSAQNQERAKRCEESLKNHENKQKMLKELCTFHKSTQNE